jgi:hypothetical protein
MRLTRLPWLALGTTILVLVTAIGAVSSIRDAATLEQVAEAAMTYSPAYLAGAPFFDVLDTLSLLTVGQHIALVVTAILVYTAWRIWHRRRKAAASRQESPAADHPARRAILREVAFAGLFLLVLVAVYAIGAVAPR